MNSQGHNEFDCSQFEALLADALDSPQTGAGQLTAELRQGFEAHRRSCAVCGPLYDEAREGMLALRSLEELETPKNLVHNILAATSLAEGAIEAPAAPASVTVSWLARVREMVGPSLAGLAHSRFATSFAMAFFSLSLTLSLAGVKLSNIPWRPSEFGRAVVLQYSRVEANVMRYYDNMRLVYEVRTRVRELRNATAPAEGENNQSKPEQQKRKPADTSGSPDQHEDYSSERDGSLMTKIASKHEGAQI